MSVPHPTPTSALYKVACGYLNAVNAKDYDKVASLLADDFTDQMWPSSLRQPDQNQRATKEVYIDRMRQFFTYFMDHVGFDVEHPVNVVEGHDSVVIQVNSNGKLNSGKEYKQEFLHLFRFNKDDKIVSHDDWTDSAYAMRQFAGGVPQAGEDGKMTGSEEAKA